MRLTLEEIDTLLGLIGNVDKGAMAEECDTEKEAERWLDLCERVEAKLLKRYWELKDRTGGRAT